LAFSLIITFTVRDATVMFSACLPTHLKGVVVQVFYPLFCGIPVVILPKFDPDQFCRFIERYKVTVGYIVPPILLALVHHPGKTELLSASRLSLITRTATNKYDLRSLKFLTSGAAPQRRSCRPGCKETQVCWRNRCHKSGSHTCSIFRCRKSDAFTQVTA
jgi:acyl-CoA synthetase (AMP-forming)/AMP-acid ligase II